MIKKNKARLIASSAVIVLPIFFGLIFWNTLPENMTTHWGADGSADGWSSRPFAVFFLPLFMLASHWFCIFCTVKDSKNKKQSDKAFGMVLWICPILSLFANGMVYAVSFGYEPKINYIGNLLFGLIFVLTGNYLPKCKQNHTIGIRVKWALENEENWNATHRFGGKVWVIGGLVIMAGTFLPENVVIFVLAAAIIALAAIPIVYSYWYYKKQLKEGKTVFTPIPKSKASKVLSVILLIFTGAVLIFFSIVMFSGDISVKYEEAFFTLKASMWNDYKVNYESVENIEYREYDSVGKKIGGLDNLRLRAGRFRNAEFGNYTRYSYNECECCVVLTVNGGTVVVNGKDRESTEDIYNELISKIKVR